ncbi:MAG TPA: translation initiation inhibitor [Pusillimonas sp.]|jgi:enamine deaminase RidA (YjgF/YER057c/UK114 family)|nr:translation initiation inhibitor [Pusillimonas sp.]MBC43848.1 translation initiation inhibitor [Pusillimonas sp.]HBT33193.1 translation initiation inhibitor [Pusillimonas sp.]HCN71793.1 translation initiation inhibitor [Pusillimonas sp.]HCP78101.1 translation initiation inhibitor [Pusillimonas sp.]|tara:strand:- start:75737 stop:76177 length:441 start_codon:yes stop_codon:yes gene_type:complete
MALLPNGNGNVRHVKVPSVPEPPNATWSNCLVIGQEVVMSGITANTAINDQGETMDTRGQGMRIMERIRALLQSAGGDLHNIYKLVIYLTNVQDKTVVSELRKQYFTGTFPCSTLIEVSAFAFPGLSIEIDAFARLDIDLRQAETS